MANFTCLAAARNWVLGQHGWDVDQQGLFGAPALTFFVGEEAHASLYKVLSMLGVGRGRVRRLAADGQGRIRSDRLPPIEGPAIVCIHEIVLNQVVVAFGDNERTKRVIASIQASGACWCGGTVWKGRAAMRISVSSWATTDRDIERSITAILEAHRAS